ncbi:hypothetical protein [Polyangium mundeleinium]|uniref:Uncharacterized protein n=1 Tax=Polyangium mundeleinium TaxID=2995306 RepID=A0ABT5EHR7_9BACT|nr:hypothetical protein [Polyangium mundeleinium]MDC0741364.1 hypothetical protein [Polyangium mundeleinium]
MLTIHKAQMHALRAALRDAFVEQMIVHLARFSRPSFGALEEDQRRKVVHLGLGRADSYGLTFEGPVRLYLELMTLLGSDFDTDPQYPWAGEILNARDSGPQMQRATLLYQKTLEYRTAVFGPGDVHTLDAFGGIQALARQAFAPLAGDLETTLPPWIASIHPQKAAFLGSGALAALVREGLDKARVLASSTDREVAFIVVFMLMFGHGCIDDPLHPWIGRALSNDGITESIGRAKRLEQGLSAWLDQARVPFAETKHTFR